MDILNVENVSSFEVFFSNNLLHILEKIFFSLDYQSFKTCLRVSKVWQSLLRSDSFVEKGRTVFHNEILKDGLDLQWAAKEGDRDKVVEILSTKMFYINNHILNPLHHWTPLIEASNHGHRDIVQLLMECGAHLNTPDESGLSPLHHAALKGHRNIVQLLVENGAHLNAPDGSGLCPLHHAASKGHRYIVQHLFENGAHLNAPDGKGLSPLHHAALKGESTTVQLLISLGADPQLTKAAKLGQYDILRELLQAGTDPNLISTSEFPLLYAAFKGHKRVVQLLLQRGANPRKQDKYGTTPLHYAARYGHKPVVKQLIDGGAELNSTDIWGRTPLYRAVKGGRKDVVKLLMDMGADQNVAAEWGKTPLTLAREKNELYIINVLTGRHNLNLLIRDFLPTARDRLRDFGNAHPCATIVILSCLFILFSFALALAIESARTQPLLRFQVSVFDNYNGTLIGYVPYKGYDKMVELLLNGTDADANNTSSNYQLIKAGKNGTEIVAEMLLERWVVDNV